MKKVLLLWCLIGTLNSLYSQSPDFTTYTLPAIQSLDEIRRVLPNKADYYSLNPDAMRDFLQAAPHQEYEQEVEYLLELPTPTGDLARFKIYRYDMMESELADNHSETVTLLGIDIDKPTRKIRLDWTVHGFHASVHGDTNGRWYVEPLYWQQTERYQVFYTKDYPRSEELDFSCETKDILEKSFQSEPTELLSVGDCQLRQYRLALATTGEYSAFHGGTVGAVGAELVTAINRVNEIFEQDLAIRLVLVANNDNLIFLDAGTDPYTNNDGGAMLAENQAEVDATIMSGNYDIGHVFSTGGGGIAGLGVVCLNTQKGRGVTGLGAPTGDPFYIDYVAHEMGHQFGGNHTFNSFNGNCDQRNPTTAYEPGGGSTIQAYAGICGAVSNVQNNSSPYYHAVSIQEIATYMESGLGNNCPSFPALSNNAPTVNAGSDYLIPINTAFSLTASGSDTDGDALTYCWEQFDLGASLDSEPTGTEADGPIIRSLSPTTSPIRNIDGSISWEALPQIARVYNFIVTVRDINATFGCTVQDQMTVTTVASTGPFAVLVPNGGESLSANTSPTITWDVAGTDMNGIDCANVIIELSLDGGATYGSPVTTANDGSFDYPLPDVTESDARIRIRCADNIFYDISDADFSIVREDFNLSVTSASTTICTGTTSATGMTFDLQSVLNYTGNVSLSAVGLPGGVTASFNPSSPVSLSANATESVALTLNNTGGLGVGTYNFMISATDGARTKTGDFMLIVESQVTQGPTLVNPPNGGTLPVDAASFSWMSVPGATMYRIELCPNAGGSGGCVFTTTGSTAVNFGSNLIPPFADGETVFWTVTAFNDNCGTVNDGMSSSEFSFTFGNIPGASLSTPNGEQSVCEGDEADDFLLNFVDGAVTGPAALTTVSAPGGVMVVYSPTPISSGQQATVTLSGEENLSPGSYTITVQADDGSNQETLDFTLEVVGDDVTVNNPMDGQELLIDGLPGDLDLPVNFSPVSGAIGYTIVIVGLGTIPNVDPNTNYSINIGGIMDGDMVTVYVIASFANGSTVRACDITVTFVDALPVEWLGFQAQAVGLSAQLEWEVLQDGLGADFQIERRMDGEDDFLFVGILTDDGVLGQRSYHYSDQRVVADQTYYYRILQRDQDGTSSYSPIRTVTFEGKPIEALLVPNPSSGATQLVVNEESAASHYQLIDGLGRVLQQGAITSTHTTIDLQGLPRAVYQVVVQGSSYQEVIRLIKR